MSWSLAFALNLILDWNQYHLLILHLFLQQDDRRVLQMLSSSLHLVRKKRKGHRNLSLQVLEEDTKVLQADKNEQHEEEEGKSEEDEEGIHYHLKEKDDDDQDNDRLEQMEEEQDASGGE